MYPGTMAIMEAATSPAPVEKSSEKIKYLTLNKIAVE
jgi:hypothetical protein